MKKLLLSIFLVISLAITSFAAEPFFIDVIVTSPNGIWTDARAYSTLNDAVTVVGANERTIVIASPQVVTNLTVPSTVTLKFERNGSITNSGYLNIQTKNIIAENRQIFTGVGNIDFAVGSVVKTGWFSNIETAFALTTNDSITLIVSKSQTITANYSPGNNVHLKWESPGNILTVSVGVVVGNLKNIEAGNFQLFAGTGDFDFLDGTRLKLSWFSSLQSVLTWIESEKVVIVIDGIHTVDHTQASSTNEFFDFISERGQLSISTGITFTCYVDTIIAQSHQVVFIGDGTVNPLANSKMDYVYLNWFNPNVDGVTDDGPLIQRVLISAANSYAKLKILEGTYYIADPGITISTNNSYIEGTNQTYLKCERTYYDDSGTGTTKYIIGQGNILNATGVENITLKDITLIGSYQTAWGNQTNGGPVANADGSKLLFFYQCTNITLDKFAIKNSFSSFVTLPAGGYTEEKTSVHGSSNPFLISESDNIKLIDCRFYDSVGEAWVIYDGNNITVDRHHAENDYGISQLDITFFTGVSVSNSKFIKNLMSDSGNLLNIVGSGVTVSNNYFKNGELDVGNEYLNLTGVVLATTFQVENVTVSNNTFYNGGIIMAVGSAATTLSWVMENINISNNSVTIDLDTRPTILPVGTYVLDYTGVRLPNRYNSRNISVNNNTILLKGAALQAGGATYNRLRFINGVMSATGYTMENISIKGNTFKTSLTAYDSSLLHNLSGSIVIYWGTWTGLTISDNIIDCPVGITIDRHDSIERLSIRNNDVYAENFLNFIYEDVGYDIDGIDIANNKFKFLNTVGHSYVSADLVTKGFGYFVKMTVDKTTSILNAYIRNNVVEAAGFVYMTNTQASTSVLCDVSIKDNDVLFVDFLDLDVGATLYALNIGRANTANDYSSVRLIDNYFNENAVTTKAFSITEWSKLDLIRNEFVGTYTFSIPTDNLASEADSRIIAIDNISHSGTFTQTLTNIDTAVTKLDLRNTTATGLGAAITGNVVTDNP
ncbi:MAG: hypothetical protein KKH70_20345 [Gammaproteobacteria bacterium]|uniref:Uncharacterized protein n=1 Tax=viral metagenome TaxID=1070528 RepID=A0A6H1ZMV6_9ZZZZ|nr:hypothetical protein [Gammaproteobacteria bacterium]MBU2395691.1 hypothetical protein [Gammaproteobacteria bacterium]